jgi:hypothetical protein
VDLASRSRSSRAGLAGARAALRLNGTPAESSEADDGGSLEMQLSRSTPLPSGGLDIEESLAEFRELVSSA